MAELNKQTDSSCLDHKCYSLMCVMCHQGMNICEWLKLQDLVKQTVSCVCIVFSLEW